MNFHFFIVSEAVKEEKREIEELTKVAEKLEADIEALKKAKAGETT